MSRLLHVVGSPSAERSRTREVAQHFLQAHRGQHPGVEVETFDIWSRELPAFDAEMIQAKFAVLRGTQATPRQQALWQRAVGLAREFNAADRLVFSVPMWNFGLPYRLKHFIDIVTLPGENWSWSAQQGYRGLLHGKRALLVYSSAGAHALPPHESAVDHQKGQMRAWLGFIGIDDVHEINVAPTLVAPEQVALAVAAAKREAEDLARRF